MDLTTPIEELRRDKERLERVIASLADLQAAIVGSPQPKRRGRGPMSLEERREVETFELRSRTFNLHSGDGCSDRLCRNLSLHHAAEQVGQRGVCGKQIFERVDAIIIARRVFDLFLVTPLVESN